MKSLVESLFDQDLVSKKLPIQKYMDDFSSYALEKLDAQERNSLFDQLFESGDVCNAAELRKSPVDLTENIIIQRRDGLNISNGLNEINYPCKYNFIYNLVFDGEQRTFIATLEDTRNGKSYYWDNESMPTKKKKKTWKGKVSNFYLPNSSYSIISNKKWVDNIIEGILLD